MPDILFNLALLDTINFCKANAIDCAGSHIEKHGRGFVYRLIRNTDSKLLVETTFHKRQIPTHYAPILREREYVSWDELAEAALAMVKDYQK